MKRAFGFLVAGLVVASPLWAAEEPHFTIDTSRSSTELKVGEKGVLSIVINPGAGKKVHDQAPLTISLKAPKGLTLAKAKLGQADALNKGNKAPEFAVELTATAAGTQMTEADLQFFVCTDHWCERQQQHIAVSTTVR
jgi:hypothetical protein